MAGHAVNGGNGVLGEQQPGREDGPPRHSRAAARVGLTIAVVLGTAVAAGIGGLSLLANIGGGQGTTHGTRVDAAPVIRVSGPPLRVVSVLPAATPAGVSGDSGVMIAFSAKLAPTSAVPAFRPAIAGHWRASGRLLTFTPTVPFAASTRYTLRIPAGRAGLRSATGGAIAKPKLVMFRTGTYSALRLAQVLSELGYLPVSWRPAGSAKAGGGPGTAGVASQEQMAFNPPAGSFTWKDGYPASLRARWLPGRPNVIVRGAVMAFKAQHKLAINGRLNEKFWLVLFAAAASAQRNTGGYSYAIVNKGSPETLTIWHNGRQVLRSLTNTGIPIDPTASGTFPVYLRFRYQIMSGTNPDGSHYADPVTFVSYFNGRDAVHYFPRGSYGSPQSLGCVELAYKEAQRAWPYLTYGSLITVTG
ncbi:MAG TPA: Ig-like domain-containing protein [Streptosporangiaceae bacterium]|nr:Ig-like domain-containing protein [Streptosporangiaceae bacterium]